VHLVVQPAVEFNIQIRVALQLLTEIEGNGFLFLVKGDFLCVDDVIANGETSFIYF
jgi:hypothetical protein